LDIKPKKNTLNVVWAVSEKIIQVVLSMLITGLIARYFGVELFGSYQFAMSVVFVATSLTWLCPAEIFYSKVDSEGKLSSVTISTSIIYRLLISILVYGGVILYVLFFKSEGGQGIFILMLSVIILYSEPLGIFRFLLECQSYYYVMTIIRMIALIVKLIIVSSFIFCDVSPVLILLPIIIEGLIVSVAAYSIYRLVDKSYVFNARVFDRLLAVSFFKQGLKFWVGLVCMNIFLKFDRLFMGSKLDKEQFGYYSAALSAFEQFSTISIMLVAVLAPVLIYRAGNQNLRRNTMLMTLMFLFMGLLGSGILYIISDFLIILLYGQEFSSSIAIFELSLIIIPFVFLDASLSTYLIKRNVSIYFSFKWVVVLLLSVVLNFFLFPLIGWQSGVMSLLFCWIIAFIFSFSFYVFDYKRSVVV
jgi:PST family polysaccharide transporter